MKKIVMSAVIALGLATSASAMDEQTFNSLIQKSLCEEVDSVSIGAFGEKKHSAQDVISMLRVKLTTKQSAEVIAKVITNKPLFNNKASPYGKTLDDKIQWNYHILSAVDVATIVNKYVSQGQLPSQINFKIQSIMENGGSVMIDSSINMLNLTQKIAGYVYPYRYKTSSEAEFNSETYRRAALIRSFLAIYGKNGALGSDLCFERDAELNGAYFAINFARFVSTPGKVNGSLITLLNNEDDSKVTTHLLSLRGVKDLFNLSMQQIQPWQDQQTAVIEKQEKALERELAERTQKSNLLLSLRNEKQKELDKAYQKIFIPRSKTDLAEERKKSWVEGTCLVSMLQSIGSDAGKFIPNENSPHVTVNGEDFVVSAIKSHSWFGKPYAIVWAIPTNSCLSKQENEDEKIAVMHNQYEKFKMAHPQEERSPATMQEVEKAYDEEQNKK